MFKRMNEIKLWGVNRLLVTPLLKVTLKLYRKYSIPFQIEMEKRNEEDLIMKNISDDLIASLTDDEKAQIKSYWGIVPASYREYGVYKHYNGFDVRFMPMSIYLPLITRRLNDYSYSEILEHKSLFGYLAKGVVRFPKCYVRTVNREYYSDDMQQISRENAIEICLNIDRLVIKDSLGGSGGHGIEILKLEGSPIEERRQKLQQAIAKRETDFVIQEYLEESEELKRFNPSSVNTIRVQSLYLNGKWSAVTVVLRYGGDGAEVDNVCSGGVAVGVHPDGSLYEFGYGFGAEQITRKGDIVFKNTKLSFIPALLKHIEEAHKYQFPIVKYIGWDMIIDKNNNPICIEINSCQNGHINFQLSAGPTFGDRTQEVIDYCKTKKTIL
jgi:hypothetical protein